MIQRLITNRSFYTVGLSVLLSLLLVAAVASGASTISTNISTGVSLTVSGAATVSGVAQMDGSLQATSTLLVTGATTLYATTTLSGESPLVLGQSTLDLTGQVEGTIFYDSNQKLLRLYDGNAWFSVATTTGGFTVSGVRIQTTNIETEYVAIGTTSVRGTGGEGFRTLTIDATSTAGIPLTLVGATAQTADLFQIVRCDNCETSYTEVFAVDAYGSASTTGSFDVAYNVDNAYFSVAGRATTTAATGNIVTEGTLTITGAAVLNGAVTLGDAITDAITITGAATTSASFEVGPAGVLSLGGFGTSTGAGGFDFGATTTIASSTPAEEFTVTGDAYFDKTSGDVGTTTIHIKSAGAAKGGCLEIETGEDTVARVYVNPGATALIVEAGRCQ